MRYKGNQAKEDKIVKKSLVYIEHARLYSRVISKAFSFLLG